MDAFTMAECQLFADVIAACQRGAKVRWLHPDGVTVREGVMRHVCGDTAGNFLGAGEDVRTALVRITTWTAEVFLPLPEFAGWLGEGYVSFES